MNARYFPLVLTVAGNILYHVSQKSVPRAANPLLTMMVAYSVGIVVCGICAVLFPRDQPLSLSLQSLNWSVVALGVGVAAVEIGFLLAYRAGWNISLAPVISNTVVSVLVIPIGVLAYREHLSFWNLLGIGFCVIGLFLVTRR